jgi:hypothetical protein
VKTEQAINNDREFVAQVIRALPNASSEIKQSWIENPRGLSKVLAEALCPPEDVIEFPVFKTIKLGTHKSTNNLRQSLKDGGNRIGDWGDDILGKTTLAKSETEITLHTATVKELTGKDWATNREINEAIRSKGYNLCPAEVGPQLRLQYPDQPKDEWLRVAMEPIADSDGDLGIFCVDRDGGGRWLGGGDGRPGSEWRGDGRFVFASRK